MIPIPVAIWAGIAGLVVLLGTGAWGSAMFIQRNLARGEAVQCATSLKSERANVREWQGKFGKLESLTNEQSAAINALFDAQTAADQKHAAELAAAKRQAQPLKNRAEEISEYRPPPGKDPDQETRAYIDTLLQRERTGAPP